MNRKTRRILVATALALTSTGAAHAETEKDLDACISQFVAQQFAGFDGKITVEKKTDVSYPTPLVLRRHDIEVSAVDPATGATLVTGTCKPKKDGWVVAVKSKPAISKVVRAVKPAAEVPSDAG